MACGKRVALVLASGGAKGFAHIGAIEELERRGYEIASVAGTSMGALVGGVYAAGGLRPVKEWMFSLTRGEILSLVDLTVSAHALVKGDRVIAKLAELVPDRSIETLRIPYSASATDLRTGEEVVFRQGSLYAAIRASISVPMLFAPVERDGQVLVDGGLVNGLPLDRVARTPGDLLVAVNLEDYAWEKPGGLPSRPGIFGRLVPLEKIHAGMSAAGNNFLTLSYRTVSVLMKRNVELALRLTPPDVYLNVDMQGFGSYDYDRAEEIAALGREQMRALLDARGL